MLILFGQESLKAAIVLCESENMICCCNLCNLGNRHLIHTPYPWNVCFKICIEWLMGFRKMQPEAANRKVVPLLSQYVLLGGDNRERFY